MSYKRILLPVDGSRNAAVAVRPAIEMAQNEEAELHFLTSLHVDQLKHQDRNCWAYKKVRQDFLDMLESLVSLTQEQGVKARFDIDEDHAPHEAIKNYVENQNIQMIIMATHGRSGLERLFVGSTTERVLRSSSIPVFVVPRDAYAPVNEYLFD